MKNKKNALKESKVKVGQIWECKLDVGYKVKVSLVEVGRVHVPSKNFPMNSDVHSIDEFLGLFNHIGEPIKEDTKSAVEYMAQSEGLPDMITFFDEQKKTPTPERYKSRLVHGMDVIELVKHWGLNFNEGNILKYLIRDKGEDISDMQKIGVYANRELKHLKDEN